MFGLSVRDAGWFASIPEGLEATAVAPLTFVAARMNTRAVLLAAFVLFCLGVNCQMLSRLPGTPLWRVLAAQALVGAALAAFSAVASRIIAVRLRRNQPTLLALLLVCQRLGRALGNALAAAVWNHTLPLKLRHALPPATRPQWRAILNSLPKQLGFPIGSETRQATQAVYAEAQIRMLVASLVAMLLGLAAIGLIGNGAAHEQEQAHMQLNAETVGSDATAEQ